MKGGRPTAALRAKREMIMIVLVNKVTVSSTLSGSSGTRRKGRESRKKEGSGGGCSGEGGGEVIHIYVCHVHAACQAEQICNGSQITWNQIIQILARKAVGPDRWAMHWQGTRTQPQHNLFLCLSGLKRELACIRDTVTGPTP